ncbi:Phospholipase/Carboxylesterase-domain-containing protein [Leucosporidium creatinivorum]|uniref:Acyl-protein thioesterase 1 n=1 Tax=Leucosporidium creatinivorum TaxID=106004 RepID=A0A1Y2DUB7_9BASI|nr:Phospholipase/Carboxylesterase-domain-containing protein [Leucosporidium creatinivorum]
MAEGRRVPTLLERRRTSTQLAAINLQAASSSVVVGEASPAGSTPTSATPLTNRRASLVPSTPVKTDTLNPPGKLEARRSSVILGQIGGGSSEAGPSIARRGSGMFAAGTGAPPPVRHPFRSSVRLDSPLSAKFPPDVNKFAPPSSVRDPLLAMSASDIRRPSFAQTIAATGESLLKGQQPRRKIRKAATRVLLAAAFLFFLAKFLGRKFPSYDLIPSLDDFDDRVPHIQFPPSFTSLVNRKADLASPPSAQPSPSLKPAKGGPRTSDEPVLEGAELRRFREDHLWGPPSDKVETEFVKPAEGHEHESTIIFVHGLLQRASDSPLAQHLPNRFPNVRWVMPQAPIKPVTVQDGAEVYAWFDMLGFPYDNALDEDPVNLYSSARLINTVVDMERDELIRNLRRRGGFAGLPEAQRPTVTKADEVEVEGEFGTKAERMWASSRMVLAGFSQGSVMTLLTGLTAKERLAGLIVMSGFMPLRNTLASLTADLERQTLPIFWGHGEADEYLTVDDALHSVSLLTSPFADERGQGGLGLTDIEMQTYPGVGHTYWGGELDDISLWIERVLPMARSSAKGLIERDGFRKMMKK